MSTRGSEMKAVILRTQAMRESDLVVVLLTAEQGKVVCAARGARRSKRRFAGGLPVGARGDAQISPGRGSMSNLEGFRPTADHSKLGRDLEAFAYANYLCELNDRLTIERDPDSDGFDRLWGALERVHSEDRDPLLLRAFELRLLAGSGLMPQLMGCAACGQGLEDLRRVPFSLGRGGALCATHGQGEPGRERELLELADTLLREGGERAVLADPRFQTRRRALRDLVQEMVRPHLTQALRSTEFFRQLRQLEGGLAQRVRDMAAQSDPDPKSTPSQEDGGGGD